MSHDQGCYEVLSTPHAAAHDIAPARDVPSQDSYDRGDNINFRAVMCENPSRPDPGLIKRLVERQSTYQD